MTIPKNKKVSLVLVLVAMLTGININLANGTEPCPHQSSGTEIVFTSARWEEIAAQAKKQGKYIFVDAYTCWCAPCKQLKNVTFKDPQAAAYYNSKFINYTVDMEKGEGPNLAEEWNVTAYPTLLYFTPEGKMIMKQTGYIDGNRLLDFGKQAIARK